MRRKINLKPNHRENKVRKNQVEKEKPRLERTIPPMVNRIINRSRAENLLIFDPRRLSSVKITKDTNNKVENNLVKVPNSAPQVTWAISITEPN